MNPAPSRPDSVDWRARIRQALTTAAPDALQLYAGDDRRRLARQREARAGQARKAGVLIPIVAGGRPRIVLTERSRSLRSHPGQISFPGGSVEPDDAGVEAAAIRESREEIGLDPNHVQILGRLPDYVTGTGYEIAPVVGWLTTAARLTPDDVEVVRVFDVPLDFVMNAEHFRFETTAINGINYRFHVIEYQNNYIWGATAALLFGLRQCIVMDADTKTLRK